MSDSTDTDTTRLADIRRRYDEVAAIDEWPLGDDGLAAIAEQSLDDVPWLLAQLDDANARGDKLYQYGQTADAAYAELARILRETEEQAQAQLDAATATIARLQQADDMAAQVIAGIERDNTDLTGKVIVLRTQAEAWRERAEDAAMAFASQTGYTPPE